MSIEIDIQTGDSSWPRAQPLVMASFPPDAAMILPTGPVQWANPDLRVFIEDDEEVVCHVGIYRRIGTWKGRKIRLGGVGGVATHADHRRKGYAGLALTAAIQTLRDERSIDFAVLVCRPYNEAFYEKRGWHAFGGEMYVEQKSGDKSARVLFDVMKPYVFDMRYGPRDGVLDLCGLPW
ncbi:MAG: GNAT family N-acetyltransferase [Rhizobiales bacterium]|nr:GNAT family N-acetyltransferase [Hyphomicrobiales bacterium]